MWLVARRSNISSPPYEGGEMWLVALKQFESLAKSSTRRNDGAFAWHSFLSHRVQRFFPPFVRGGWGGSRRPRLGFPGS